MLCRHYEKKFWSTFAFGISVAHFCMHETSKFTHLWDSLQTPSETSEIICAIPGMPKTNKQLFIAPPEGELRPHFWLSLKSGWLRIQNTGEAAIDIINILIQASKFLKSFEKLQFREIQWKYWSRKNRCLWVSHSHNPLKFVRIEQIGIGRKMNREKLHEWSQYNWSELNGVAGECHARRFCVSRVEIFARFVLFAARTRQSGAFGVATLFGRAKRLSEEKKHRRKATEQHKRPHPQRHLNNLSRRAHMKFQKKLVLS